MKKTIYTLIFSLLILSFNLNELKAACPHRHAYPQMQQNNTSGYTSGMGFAQYPKALEPVIKKLQNLPEGKQLIEEANKEGPITIKFQRGLSFAAFWETSQRVIVIDPDKNPTEGIRLTSLVFELHNALHDTRFQDHIEGALTGSLNKGQYVESLERMEHQTGLKTAALLQKGVKEKRFPHDAYQPIFQDFAEHYHMQQMTGHSQWIANSYDRMMHNRSQRITAGR